jgi:hypothetical protein
MATKTEPVRRAVARVGEGIQQKAWTVGRDKRAEQKKRLAWMGLSAGLGAVATLLARKLASKAWRVATGEEPPTKK